MPLGEHRDERGGARRRAACAVQKQDRLATASLEVMDRKPVDVGNLLDAHSARTSGITSLAKSSIERRFFVRRAAAIEDQVDHAAADLLAAAA